MGLHVYDLRRFVDNHFDVYFQLCHNGTPHWEREKRLWEEEQEQEWTIILSNRQKWEEKANLAYKESSFCFATFGDL